MRSSTNLESTPSTWWLYLQSFWRLIFAKSAKSGLIACRNTVDLQPACTFNICLKRNVVRDDSHWTQSVLCPAVRWKGRSWNKTPNDSRQRKCLMVSLYMQMHGKYWFSHHVRAIQQHQILFSLPQLAFSPGNAVDCHLPICLSVASFHWSTAIGSMCVCVWGGEVAGGSGRKQARVQASRRRIIQCLAVTGEKAWQICPKSKPVGVG